MERCCAQGAVYWGQQAEAGTWGLNEMRCRAVVCEGWLSPRAGRALLQAWEEAASVSMAVGTDPAPWACFDLGNCQSLSACDLPLGCPVYTPGKTEEGVCLIQMGAQRCKVGLCFEHGNCCVT